MKAQAAPPGARGRQAFLKLVSHHMEAAAERVRRELAGREALGDLLRGEVTAHDVVDAVLLRAQQEFTKDPKPRRIGKARLIELAMMQIEAAVTLSRSERAPVLPIAAMPIKPGAPETLTLSMQSAADHALRVRGR